jgi:hypothetical protein
MKYADCRECKLENMCTQKYAGLSCVRTDSKLSDFLKFVELLLCYHR